MRLRQINKLWSKEHPLNFLFLVLAFLWSFYTPDDWDIAFKEIEIGFFNRIYNLTIDEPRKIIPNPVKEEDFTILLVMESSLAQWEADEGQAAWPISFSHHAQNLRRVLEARPKLVILDLLFLDKHSDMDQFIDVLQGFKENNIPVIVPNAPSQKNPDGIIKAFLPYVTLASAVTGDNNRKGIIYELCQEKDTPSIALRAYQILTKQDEFKNLDEDKQLCPPESHNLLFNLWPSGEPNFYERANITVDEVEEIGLCSSQESDPKSNIISDILMFFGEEREIFCSSYPYLPAHLLSYDLDPRIDVLIKDSTVIYGKFLNGENDIISPPTIENAVSGGISHIVALDNLLQFGGSYISDDEPYGDIILFAMMLVIYLVFTFIENRVSEDKDGNNIRQRYSLALLLYVFVILTGLNILFAYIQFSLLNIIPSNWLTITIAIIALSLDYFKSYASQFIAYRKNGKS